MQSRSVEIITIIMLKFRSNILYFKTRNFLKLLTTDFVADCGFFFFFLPFLFLDPPTSEVGPIDSQPFVCSFVRLFVRLELFSETVQRISLIFGPALPTGGSYVTSSVCLSVCPSVRNAKFSYFPP